VVVVDSSGWIEFFTDGPKAEAYGRHLRSLQNVATPAVVVYEVYKKIKRERGEEMAKLCVAQMQKTRVVPIDQDLALRAADLSLEFSLPMADSFVLATARVLDAMLVTSDADFKGVPRARLL
jgi:toxin FitB